MHTVPAITILLSCHAAAFSPSANRNIASNNRLTTFLTAISDETFEPPNTLEFGISEPACTEAASRMKRVQIPVPSYISNDETAGISYIHWPASDTGRKSNTPPLLLVHGFDSSCLEYRRLGPQLSSLGMDVYAVDLLGWGYTQLNDISSFSAQAKVDALRNFWKEVGNNRPVVVGGASLGGAAAIEFATTSDACVGAILLDAQGFVDGIGPMAMLPKPIAKLGVEVLKSVPLRSSANQMSYYNPKEFATEDALKVGRMHCLREGWNDALVSFMQSGGFSPSEKVSQINVPSLVLWGRQDGILDGTEFANKFIETLPDGRLEWIEECGHVPHLEQPEVTAKVILEFLQSDKFEGVVKNEEGVSGYVLGAAGLVGAAALAEISTLLLN
mmetsp:Transcript_4278/g.4699  ORF Transcript_4278/g.4699 Transcript_4278/m.4699 type:complete len:387 (-) Transcript_4278:438-1598(-)